MRYLLFFLQMYKNLCNAIQFYLNILKINLFYSIVKVFYYICELINTNKKLKLYGKQQLKQW